jgi:multicomponent Na+:H+ antiporter subunit D
MVAAIAVLLAGGLAVGVVPGFASGVGRAAAAFVDQRGYVSQALTGTTAPALASPPTEWTTSGVLLGLLACALAVGVAVAGLYWRAPAKVRPVLSGLHALHSGHVGDYAAWLVFGSAALAGLLIV